MNKNNPNNISVIMNYNNNLSNETENNNNQQKTYHSDCLKHLIRFTFFKKDINSQNNSFQNKLTQAYLINTKVIDKLMKIYNLRDIITYFENNKMLTGRTYQNIDDYFFIISKFIKENNVDYINNIKQKESKQDFEFNEKEKYLKPKYLNRNKYLDDFEIIDQKFANFLKNKFIGIEIINALLSIVHVDIFLIINFDKINLYQIMSLNMENILTFKNIIQIDKNKAFSLNALNHYLFKLLSNKLVQNLFSNGNLVSLENNNLILSLHSTSKNSDMNYSPKKNKFYSKNRNRNKNSSPTSLKSNASNDSLTSTLCFTHLNLEFNNKIPIVFQLGKKIRKEISIEFNKTVKELIKLFFKSINKSDLYNDKNISFYYFDKYLAHDSGEFIGSIFNQSKGSRIVIFKDLAQKIKI